MMRVVCLLLVVLLMLCSPVHATEAAAHSVEGTDLYVENLSGLMAADVATLTYLGRTGPRSALFRVERKDQRVQMCGVGRSPAFTVVSPQQDVSVQSGGYYGPYKDIISFENDFEIEVEFPALKVDSQTDYAILALDLLDEHEQLVGSTQIYGLQRGNWISFALSLEVYSGQEPDN